MEEAELTPLLQIKAPIKQWNDTVLAGMFEKFSVFLFLFFLLLKVIGGFLWVN